jgi:hypothetical protein
MRSKAGLWAVLSLSLMLSACGGSSDKTTEQPVAVISTSAPADSTFSLEEGDVTVKLDSSGSTSPRNDLMTYRWELVERPVLSESSLSAIGSAANDFEADLPGNYVVSLIVDDGTVKSSAVNITFTATTPFPVAHTKTAYSVALGSQVLGLDASESTLPTGATGELTYLWTLSNKPKDSAGYLTNAKQSKASLNVDLEGDYTLQLVAMHGDVMSEPVEVIVTVASGNAQPLAKVDDITIILGQEVVLDGSDSVDPEGEPLQYRWQWAYTPVKTKGVPVPELTGTTTSTVRFMPQAAAVYQLKFFVFDGTRKSEEKEITVTVKKDPDASENAAPIGKLVATGYYPSYSIGEQEVGLRAEFNFVGYDPEGEDITIIDAQLIVKPETSTVELVKIGSWKPLGKKINKLDVVGNYRVRMTVSDGVNQLVVDANMQAMIGQVNGQPSTSGVKAQATSVIVGNALVFDASSKDPNNDPMTFYWELTDKPDNSNAVIEAVIEPESGELRRAKVITDVPGSYTARLMVEDDRGLRAKSYAQDSGFAKLTNTKPEILSVVWARSWGRLNPGESYYQILPCMSLLHRPIVVDPDGDEIDIFEHVYNELISTPEGGEFTSSPSEIDCPDSRGQVFNKPGSYTFRYYATDLIEDAVPYDFIVNVDSFENAKGVRLRSLNSRDESLWQPLPYETIPLDGYVFSPKSHPILEDSAINWSLEAVDGDYTIENVIVRHINGGLDNLTPYFEGLSEGQIIKQGESLPFKTWMRAVTCIRNENSGEGFHFSFNIKEIPEITFVYEGWLGANNSSFSTWTACDAE